MLTAPIHLTAGNPIHAAQAELAGFRTLAGAVAGPVGAIIAAAGTAGLTSIFTEAGLNDDKKSIAVQLQLQLQQDSYCTSPTKRPATYYNVNCQTDIKCKIQKIIII